MILVEAYLNSETFSEDDNFNISDYNTPRADHPSGKRHGGVRIYYKESAPIKMFNISYVQYCICFDLKIENKHCAIVSLYRLTSQSTDELENFKQSESEFRISYPKESVFKSCYW